MDIMQGSMEWLRMRAGHVTAGRTEDVKAMKRIKQDDGTYKYTEGETRKKYKRRIALERIMEAPIMEGYVSQEMQRGIDLEPVARAAYEAHSGNLVDQMAFAFHPSIKWFGASPDGLIGDDGLVEIKCPNTETHFGYLLDGVPPTKYHDQMIAQCACTGRKWVDFVSYDDRIPKEDLQLFVVRFVPTAEQIAETERAVIKFLDEVNVLYNKMMEGK
jgi:hypothetical protein